MRVVDDQDHQTLTPKTPPESPSLEKPPETDPSPTDPESNDTGFLPVLKNSRFLVLWIGQIFSQLADKVYLVLMISIISTYFSINQQHITNWVSAIMIAFTIPAVLFGSFAGVYVDRWLKKEVLVLTNIVRGALVFAILPLLWVSQDWGTVFGIPVGFYLLLTVTFLVSTLTQFFAPAEQAVLPLILPRKHLLPANSLYTTTMMALLIFGFAVGEPLLDVMESIVMFLNENWTFGPELVVGGGYAIAGIILILLKTGETKAYLHKEHPHVFEDIWDGILYLKENHHVRNAIIQLVILFSVLAALAVLAVSIATNIPELEADQFGFLLASGGVGLAISASIVGHWGDFFSYRKLCLGGSMGIALALAGLATFSHNLIICLLMTGLLGAFVALVSVPMQTTIQAETPEEKRGKVFGLQNNAVNIALSLPLALAGVAETLWGLQPVLWGLSGLVLLGGGLTWMLIPIDQD